MNFEKMIAEFCAAVEAGDGTRLAALFSEDGIYHDTFYGEFQGREAIRGMLEERFYGDAEKFRWDMRDLVCDGRYGYARWIFSYTSIQPDSKGTRVVFQGTSCFEMNGEYIGKYSESFDSGKALQQLGFSAGRLEKLLRRWNESDLADPAVAAHLRG